ncbi:STM4504/CBY_0614 family protein [Paenibacillus sp.]|uniref:STM4504/CBY_0614 family protein n=1 Tax=Paenibacillus sp. TaxID=58172 RepID=UPI0028A74D3B|nr:hypothetical protein [Paenibacillus sp.]
MVREMFEIYSKRQNPLLNKPIDPFEYDKLSEKFRIQVYHILRSSTGKLNRDGTGITARFWLKAHTTLCRELGRLTLGANNENLYLNCLNFILSDESINVLDGIDYLFNLIEKELNDLNDIERLHNSIEQRPEHAITELNRRFKENGIGYQFENGQLIRIDSQYIHQETVKPAIFLLGNNNFTGAQDEFLKAHEHYRNGMYKESIAEALKSFESTMKTICVRFRWEMNTGQTASKLIETLVKNELIPTYIMAHMNGLRSVLESGIPSLRNKTSGHGQGEVPIALPEHYAAYALHLTASNIVFLVECYSAKKH